MRTWLIELGAAAALAIAGVTLWALPANTPVVGNPPEVYGWLCIVVGALIAVLSTANYFRIEFQSPLRRRSALPVVIPPPAPSAQEQQGLAPQAAPASPQREFTRAMPRQLVDLAGTAGLTGAQANQLLRPHVGKWIVLDGKVTDVRDYDYTVQVSIDLLGGDADIDSIAHFNGEKERAASLPVAAQVRLQGKIREVRSSALLKTIVLDECQFAD
jgi:hypothetical protein